ncbi:VWA domain-containing protein, partial [candidate division KSB1 bacterium]|nr:VWA domain-containing protein [candidate division KSB1 bacterium]
AATRLISPQITLKHKQGEIPILYFWHWFRLSDDQGYVQLSVNGGPWRTVAGPFSGKSDVWSQAPPVELSTYIDSTVSIAFSFFSGNYYSDNGWYIDDIRIEGIDTTSYRLDFITLTYQQIDASNFCDSSKVHSYVTVSDSSGNALSDLGVNNFSVKEDGEVQSPITVEHIGATQQPISVAMVLDRSSSMAGQPLVDAKNAAIDFVHKMADHDMGAVISFAADVVVDQEFTTDKDLLVTAIEAISNSESTHHYDGLMEAINQCGPLTGRKAIITLTDGKDGSSVTTIDSCIAAAQKAQLPIFTIGLLGGSGIDEEALKKIASETGGLYYFSPSSEKLAYIYNVIAEHILQNQYKITYSPRNTNGDGVTSRLVEITASYNGSTDSKSKSYIPAPCDTLVPFYPITVSDTIPPSQRFWLDLKVGKENQQVNDLFGIAFKLKYDENVLIFHTIKEDEFIGNDPVSHFEADSISGIIASGVSRKAGSGGVNGFGTVVKAEFEVRKNIADGTVAWFELLDVYAINSQGVEIRLDTLQYKIVVSSCLTTWPGDANNDGFVDEKDVLPIGFFWHTSGNESPCRQAAPFEWQPCCCVPWTPTAATYANSNGDGIIDEKDVLALGMNWHKAHSISKKRSATSLAFDSDSMLIDIPNTLQKGQEIDIRISVPETKDLFGFSFKAQFANYEFLEFLQIKPGGFLGGNLISFGDIDIENGIASLGQTKKSGAAGANGSGCVAIILLKVKDTAPENFRIKVHVTDITANDSQGTRLAYNDATVYFTSVNYQAIQLPTKFALEQNYPNPFNPETTISYQLPRATNVKLIVLNSVGQHVRTLVAEEKSAGRHIVRWNGLNGLGRKVSSGIYFYQLEAGEFTQMKKMILLQ